MMLGVAAVRGYRPALDGVRAVAIAGVMAQHAHLGAVRAGGLGVDVFFVLSGYLITGLLLTERRSTGGVQLSSFYLRRAARLYPALLVTVVVGGVLATSDLGRGPGETATGGLVAAAYVTDVMSFTGTHAWLVWGQTWSLSLEEHFYLLWPAALLLMLRRGGGRLAWRVALAGAAVGVAVVEAQSSATAADRVLASYQPQTHAAGLLLGCALAFAPSPPAWWRHLSLPALAGLVVLFTTVPDFTTVAFHRVALPLTWAATGLLLVALERGGAGGALLAAEPLRTIGVVSYGLYLYHETVFALVSTHLHGQPRAVVVSTEMAAALILAVASYYLMEQPIRRRAHRRKASAPSAPLASAAG